MDFSIDTRKTCISVYLCAIIALMCELPCLASCNIRFKIERHEYKCESPKWVSKSMVHHASWYVVSQCQYILLTHTNTYRALCFLPIYTFITALQTMDAHLQATTKQANVAILRPSGEKAREITPSVLLSNSLSFSPVTTFQIRTMPAHDPEAMRLPSGEKAMDHTA
jgi:hypothetical protein